MKKSNQILFSGLFLIAIFCLTSCDTYKKVAYFQDVTSQSKIPAQTVTPLKFQKGDKLYVQVKVQGNEVLSSMFSMLIGSNYSNVTSTSNTPYGYTIDSKGNIDFPVVGIVHLEGLTRDQAEEVIKAAILKSGQAKEVTVVVSYLNLSINVMGEVASPGSYSIEKDHVTILEAISMARDLTIYGRRDNVKVLRQENGHQNIYTVDLTNITELMKSPVYYLKQNDVVYVEPNKAKAQNSEIGSMTTLWFSATSILISIASLVVNILNK